MEKIRYYAVKITIFATWRSFLGCDLTFGAENLNFKGERRASLQESFLQMTLRDGQKLPNEA